MSTRIKLTIAIGATLFGLALIMAPAWASAQTTSTTCAGCTDHNNQPGDGTGGFTFTHDCVMDTGQPTFLATFWNPTKGPVTATVTPYTEDRSTPLAVTKVLVVPAGKSASTTILLPVGANHVTFYVTKSTSPNGNWTGNFDCPCTVPTTSSTLPPTSKPIPSSAPSVVGSTAPAGSPPFLAGVVAPVHVAG